MPYKVAASEAKYFLGFDGGGTKTECVLADSEGHVVGRSVGGPSNPLRTGYTRAWFALSEAADSVLCRQKLSAGHIRGICAGLGGAGRSGVVRRATTFFERSYPNAAVRVTTDLEIALEAAFGSAEGIILVAGTGSAAFGRGENGRTARAGGRGPWFSDEGSAFDIGKRAFRAVVEAEEARGPETALSKRIFKWHQVSDWDRLLDQISKNPDDVFPKTFPLVAELAERGDEVSRGILSDAALSLDQLGWHNREIPVAKVGGVYGRSKHFDAAIDAELNRSLGRVRLVPVEISPAEAAARIAVQLVRAKGNAA
ncbi:MAG: BadF/BadG/BcrA/BcrD ATPase family protein [Candidatus Acidiferrales bacterium]